MYKEIFSELTNNLIGVYDELNNLYIPTDPDNSDYQTYLKALENANKL
jgi:hypothetical protein